MLRIIHFFLQLYLHYKWKRKRVNLNSKSYISKKTFFEGENYLGENSVFIDSSMGYASYVADDSYFPHTSIGRYCSIGYNSSVVIGDHPSKDFVSTHPSFYREFPSFGPRFVKKNKFEEIREVGDHGMVVKIGNDVWVGAHVIIMNGVSIGDGAIVGAGAVVTKDVPAYSIVGGVPARLIRYRFAKKDIDALQITKWWDRDIKWIRENAEWFNDIEQFKKHIGNDVWKG